MKGPWEIGSDAGAKVATLGARKQGAIIFAGCIVLLLINLAMIVGTDEYAPKLLAIGVGFLPMSLYVMVTGRAGTRNEPKAPLWWWVGAVVVIGVSLAAGLGAVAFVGD